VLRFPPLRQAAKTLAVILMSSKIDIYKTGTPTDKGSLGYYNLLDWWDNDFTNSEKLYIVEKYIPMGGGELTKGTILGSSANVINFLTGLQSWFTTLADKTISEKILTKAESLLTGETPILDTHFLYGCLIEHYYKKRNIDLRFYELAKQYCLKQIAISKNAKEAFLSDSAFSTLPRHKGYEQLAIILEKEKDYNNAMLICLEAKKAGWNTDWDKRILTLEKKMK
jgi:hypothetical protein